MSYISIIGGTKLEGEILLQGSKNAVLPILAAGVLCEGPITIRSCPDISDVRELLHALSFAGVRSSLHDGVLEFDASEARSFFFGPKYTEKTRGGVLLLGAFLGRFHKAGMAYPGGCVIGARPIDLHCKVLRALGIELSEQVDGVYGEGMPKGGRIVLSYPSVGATENALLTAACAKGRTEIFGAAREPEIAELCRFLNKAGARIRGIGTSFLIIDGVSYLRGTEYTVTGDRIVAGTYLAGAAMTGGEVILKNTRGVCLKGISESLQRAGARMYRDIDRIVLRAPKRLLPIKEIKTAPFPAFPTDMQSQTVALLSLAQGESRICETVFESRFGVVPELQKMGADVKSDKNCILIRGVESLHGAEVEATDLRSGAALVLAGLAAKGESRINQYNYIARGYEDICGDFAAVGARISLREEK